MLTIRNKNQQQNEIFFKFLDRLFVEKWPIGKKCMFQSVITLVDEWRSWDSFRPKSATLASLLTLDFFIFSLINIRLINPIFSINIFPPKQKRREQFFWFNDFCFIYQFKTAKKKRPITWKKEKKFCRKIFHRVTFLVILYFFYSNFSAHARWHETK